MKIAMIVFASVMVSTMAQADTLVINHSPSKYAIGYSLQVDDEKSCLRALFNEGSYTDTSFRARCFDEDGTIIWSYVCKAGDRLICKHD